MLSRILDRIGSAAHVEVPVEKPVELPVEQPAWEHYTARLPEMEFSEQVQLPVMQYRGMAVLQPSYLSRLDQAIYVVTYDEHDRQDVIPMPSSFLGVVMVPIVWLPDKLESIFLEYTPAARDKTHETNV